uniref:NADH-ubiquinone oxidoreductase chain 2 n=1 Tax=Thienemanniella tusimufegea TaxID=3072307 RepID=A0AA51M6A7_9DIPT|nr:NADH dehydrogenase subunit 2 [Thienemanniella tusimufegea]WML69356.1 NADH dehydrogenase subunit 2 [Thienemanniella tusimufegea]
MFKFSYKFLFIFSLMFGTLMSISSMSWMSVWMGLEINLLSFIPLISNKKNIFLSESSIKYFIVQAMASAILLFIIIFSFIINSNNLKESEEMNLIFNIIISSIMMMKMGAAPFHFWFPSISEGLNWINNLILMTWQKIAPMMILSYCLNFNYMIILILMSTFVGSLGGLNQTSLRKLMAFSSINHMGWMMSSLLFNENIWFIYYLFYFILLMNIIFMMNLMNIYFMNQTFMFIFSNKYMKIIFFLLLLSLGGLPPFLGFFPKWILMELMISKNLYFILFFMILFTLITLFFYLRLTYSAFLLNNKKMNWLNMSFMNKNYLKSIIFYTLICNFSLILINLIYYI